MIAAVRISPRDPLIARDGRPFSPGGSNRVRCLDWPYPSTMAGAMRTLLGNRSAPARNGRFDEALISRLKRVEVGGPFFSYQGQLFWQAPRDLLPVGDDDGIRARPLRPQPCASGAGCNLPHAELWPIGVNTGAKPTLAPAFWSSERLADWLAEDSAAGLALPSLDGASVGQKAAQEGYLSHLPKETRVHVGIDHYSGTAQEGLLYQTEGLVFGEDAALMLRVEVSDVELAAQLAGLRCLATLGGERRLAEFMAVDGIDWSMPRSVSQALAGARAVRMLLATPALFDQGWLPGWVEPSSMRGTPPGMPGLWLRLRGATLERWRPISGWDLHARGPKAGRRLAPAGSVYFFEVEQGDPAALAELWLKSISDNPQDCCDGFGLVMWGRWDPRQMGGGRSGE
ncbi:MAG: type III-B CRISPR module-associated protein Cmr3 [Bacillota bacterium]